MTDLNLNGYTDIPNGKIANIVTYLEMMEKPALLPKERPDLSLERVRHPPVERYHAIFRAVGEDWLWLSRLAIERDALARILATDGFEVFFVRKDGQDIGLVELDCRGAPTIELAYFGMTPNAIGTGIGRWMMNAAINRVFDHHKARRFFVHTCTLDAPHALAFYLKSGFIPYKRAIEIADDPRLSGHIDRNKGQHHPIIA